MLQKMEIEVEVCDVCEHNEKSYTCKNCGKVFCYDCADKHGKHLRKEMCVNSSRDPFYCTQCFTQLISERDSLVLALWHLEDSIKQWRHIDETWRKVIKDCERTITFLMEEEVK